MWKVVITLMFAYIFHPGIFNTSKVFHTGDDSNELNRFKYRGGLGGGFGDEFGPPGWPMIPQMPGAGGGGGGGGAGGGMNGFGPPPIPFRKRRDLDQYMTSTVANYAFAQLANHTPIAMRQMFNPMFTAPQMFIPSLSTLPNNMINPNGPEADNQPPPVDNSYKDRWITYLVPMILQVRLYTFAIYLLF